MQVTEITSFNWTSGNIISKWSIRNYHKRENKAKLWKGYLQIIIIQSKKKHCPLQLWELHEKGIFTTFLGRYWRFLLLSMNAVGFKDQIQEPFQLPSHNRAAEESLQTIAVSFRYDFLILPWPPNMLLPQSFHHMGSCCQ